jgi:fructose-bisphosphate aldolase, class II
LERIRGRINGRMSLALHGTTGIPPAMLREIISKGVSKINVNKAVLGDYLSHLGTFAGQLSLTKLTEDGIAHVQKGVENYIDICFSAGKA